LGQSFTYWENGSENTGTEHLNALQPENNSQSKMVEGDQFHFQKDFREHKQLNKECEQMFKVYLYKRKLETFEENATGLKLNCGKKINKHNRR